jgi:hypothetical protein
MRSQKANEARGGIDEHRAGCTGCEAAVERFCDNLKTFLIAVSWGGYESLQWPVCALKGPSGYYTDLPFTMVRLYIGLEDPDLSHRGTWSRPWRGCEDQILEIRSVCLLPPSLNTNV